jgi:ribulose-phosphate 3-epimerase
MNDYRDPTQRLVAASILAADWSRLADEVSRAVRAETDWIHLDVMDGHFVDNISFGPQFVQTVTRTNDIFFDVHLMIMRPDHFLARFIGAGADNITVHVEADHDVAETLRRIRGAGLRCGLAMKPATDFSAVEPFLGMIDLLLVMTVEPGFGGQKFIEAMMPKCAAARKRREEMGYRFHIEVDGGIHPETADTAAKHGANVMVAGTAVFGVSDMAAAIRRLRG